MKLAALHSQLLGDWIGENQLWLDPKEPPQVSPSTLTVAPTAQGKFLTLAYTWAFEGKVQEGLLLVGDNNKDSIASAGWVDSFHQSGKVMQCIGSVEGSGFAVSCHYPAPPGPDWGWRLSVNASAAGELIFEMHNVPPGGDAELAVRAVYQRPRG
ncbi:MAG: DUF1579 family protein [Pseudomonadota bacterium]